MATRAPHLVLVGPMGAGKSTVGARLARKLGRPLVDSDADLAAAGHDAATIARTRGVDALHDIERRHLLAALAAPTPSVVAAAASVVEAPAIRAALREAFVALLTASPPTLAARAAGGAHRRDLGDDAVAAGARLAARREPLYRQVADIVVDVEDGGADAACDAILAAFDPGG
jgi:shikimate kinase